MSLCVLTGTKVTTFAISFFTLVWTHSVEKVEWQEDWKIINSKLKIVEARVKGSGAGMEPDGNEAHYSETLYRLPKTGLNYEIPAAIHDGQLLYDKYELPRDRPILNSLQSTFKYLPRNDWTFAEIAARHPEAFIVLVGHMGSGGIAERLLERMRPHFKQRGLEIENHLRILPRLDYGDFMGLFAISHHTIDTIDWNGGNSSMQSFSLDCPVVTLPTAFMRGRHTVSMLEVLELPELIADNADDYIAISCKLLDDPAFSTNCGVCIKGGSRSTDTTTGAWVGGLYMSPADQSNVAIMKIAPQPTAGACPSGSFFVAPARYHFSANRWFFGTPSP